MVGRRERNGRQQQQQQILREEAAERGFADKVGEKHSLGVKLQDA